MSGTVSRKHLSRLGLSTLALAVGLLTSGTAFAQDAAPAARKTTNPGMPDDQRLNVQANGEADQGQERRSSSPARASRAAPSTRRSR